MDTKSPDYKVFFHADTVVKNDPTIKDITKLIFSDIAYFSFLRAGHCKASNLFFAKKYGKSNGTISKAISELVSKGYIDRYLDEHKNRTIYVHRSKFAAEKEKSDANKDTSALTNGNDNQISIPGALNRHTKLNDVEMEDLTNNYFSNE